MADEISKRGDAPQGGDDATDLPRGIDPPLEPQERAGPRIAARDLHATLVEAMALPAHARPAAVADKTRRFQAVTDLPTDGVYGPRTRAELARVLGVPVSSLPPVMPRSGAATPRAPAQAPADTDTTPAWLPVAAALARWTEDARASDSVASQKLQALATHAAYIAPRTETAMRGIVVGQVPTAPTQADAAAWAASAWARARAEGASARASLTSHAQSITRQAERALVDVRRALDRETDSAVRGALTTIEAGLVASLRPLSTAIREGIARPLGLPIIIAGLAFLAFSGGRRRS